MGKNIGFISTRFAGTDGVSLESAKWAHVLWQDQHISFWYSGRSDRHNDISYIVPEAHFEHPENAWINQRIWGKAKRSPLLSKRIRTLANYLKSTLYDFQQRFDIELVIPQNVLTIPMHVPLGLALTEFLAETLLPAILHHHDFYWERNRFSVNCIQDYLNMAFPSTIPHLRHVVINRPAEKRLSFRCGVSSTMIPNVFDFDSPPPVIDDYAADIRTELNLTAEDILILQPTRIVPRKGIENSIRLLALLKNPKCKLIVSHEAGDEGVDYKDMLIELAHVENVDIRFVSDRIGDVRRLNAQGRKVYTLWDLYPHADFVTFPSIYEGFGNALIEAIYFKKPVFVNRYAIYISDIEPKGFRFVAIDNILTNKAVREVEKILQNNDYRQEIIEHNFAIARKYYSYQHLQGLLRGLITQYTGL